MNILKMWNTSPYNSIDSIVLPPNKILFPSWICIHNTVIGLAWKCFTEHLVTAVVANARNAITTYPDISIACKMNMKCYLFD